MGNFLQAYKHYNTTDGYRLDGYLVGEFVDGYSANAKFVDLSEAISLDRRLQKFDRMLRWADSVKAQDLRQLPPNLPDRIGSMRLVRPVPSPQMEELRNRLIEQNYVANQEHAASLAQLRIDCATTLAAIQYAAEPDGYGQ